VAVISHVNPEGDAIGSTLAATLALRAAGKRTGAFNADPVPPELRHLPGASEVRCAADREPPYACCLVVDTSDLARTGGLVGALGPGAVVLNVDHHPGNSRFGTENWVDPAASSAGEMVARLLREGAFPLTPDVAANLYAAILTDTGGFRYANTSPAALRTAAEMVEAGADPESIARGLSGNRSLGEWRLLGEVLTGLRVEAGGRVAWVEVTMAACARAGVGMQAADEVIEYPRNLAGVRIAIAFKERSADEVRVSLRSHGAVDVAALAAQFGGGGHRNAAGCTVRGGIAEVRATVLAAAATLVGC
jgi:phosphoesterase RecJ-like protein